MGTYYGYSGSDYNELLKITQSANNTVSTSDAVDFVLAFLGISLGILIFIILAIIILQIIGMWKVYTKAGEKGWKAIIPFYNIAILYKISGMSPYLVFIYIALFIPVINIFAGIAIGIIDLYQKINLMKAFKSSTGLTVAMLLVPFITYLILGFGKSEYVGFENKDEVVTTENN